MPRNDNRFFREIDSHGNHVGGSLHSVAQPDNNGFMSAADKTKLDAVGLGGTFTMAAAATKVVSDANIVASSLVQLFPTNAAAATLMSGTKSLYVSAIVAGTSFTVATADANAAAGTETFAYRVIA